MTTAHALTTFVEDADVARNQETIIFIGPQNQPTLSPLVTEMKSRGLRLVAATTPADLAPILRDHARTTVVVYCERSGQSGHRVLEQLSQARRHTPVIVVVDRADFTHYYELMCAGAYDYYELSEGPEVIARAVRWAARTRGA